MFIYNMLSESFINDNAILSMAKHHKRRRRMRGGMANFDKDNKLVEQDEKDGEIKNIPMEDFLDEKIKILDTIEDKNDPTYDNVINSLLTSYVEMIENLDFNLNQIETLQAKIADIKEDIQLEKNNYEFGQKLTESEEKIKNIKQKRMKEILETYELSLNYNIEKNNQLIKNLNYLKEQKIYDKKENKNISLGSIVDDNIYRNRVENIRENDDDTYNPLYKKISKQAEDAVKTDPTINETYERGNKSEDYLIKHPLILQEFSGDFSKIFNSKDIDAYDPQFINNLRENFLEKYLNINDEMDQNKFIVDNILKFFPVDGISDNTLYELKSYSGKNKNVFNANDKDDKYNITKLLYKDVKLLRTIHSDTDYDYYFDGVMNFIFDYNTRKK